SATTRIRTPRNRPTRPARSFDILACFPGRPPGNAAPAPLRGRMPVAAAGRGGATRPAGRRDSGDLAGTGTGMRRARPDAGAHKRGDGRTAMSGETLTTNDHDTIRRWAEERDAKPATVPGTEHGDHL